MEIAKTKQPLVKAKKGKKFDSANYELSKKHKTNESESSAA